MMQSILKLDWSTIFTFDTPILEIFIRGTVVYLALFTILRLVLRRESGTLGISNLLVVVLIADAAQNVMADDYRSIPDGLMLVATIIFWSYVLDWLGYHFPVVQRFIHPPALLLVKHGRMLRRNMQRELITRQELIEQLREQGVDDLADVKEAYIEGDGRISVLVRAEKTQGTRERVAG